MTPNLRCIATFTMQAALLSVLLPPWALAVDTDGLVDEVQTGMQLWHVPGMSVAVVDSEAVQFQRGFGTTEADGGAQVDEHTLFAIASTTKAMVVTGILMLADEELLSLDDLAIKYIPELHFGDPALTQQITIRDLLAHRTGLPSTDAWPFLQGMALEDQIWRLRHVDPVAGIRERLIYQNTMFELAGLIIERVSGKTWDDFLAERVWHPIGMQETYGSLAQAPATKTHVLPYRYIEEKLTQAEWDFDKGEKNAAGSVWSSIHDMSLWAQFLLRGATTAEGQQLLTDEAVAAMFEPQQLATPDDFYPTVELTQPNWRTYGLAWFQQDFQGRKIEFHTGSLSGLIAIIGLDRVEDRAIIVLGNRDHAEMRHALLWSVMDNSAKSDKRDWNQDIFDLYQASADEAKVEREQQDEARIKRTKPGLPIAEYAGTYSNIIFGELMVVRERKALSLISGRHAFRLEHWHHEVFAITKPEWDFRDFVTFEIGPGGAITNMVVFDEDFEPVTEELQE